MVEAVSRAKRTWSVKNVVFLALAQLSSGVGIASGIAVGGLLAEELTASTSFAGFSQTASILGAAILAIPLAGLARRHTRRRALSLGFALAAVGALCILVATHLEWALGFFFGMFLIGSATATGLQARYAATDGMPDEVKGRMMSSVVWATTIGSVLGPNLSEPGARFGKMLGLDPLSGPFMFSVAAFVLASAFASRVTDPAGKTNQREDSGIPSPRARDIIGGVVRNKVALFGIVTVVTAQMMMSSVMVMTPVHMAHDGMALHFVGLVISVHILGMYGLSPIFGWLCDRFTPRTVVIVGYAIFALAFSIGIVDALLGSTLVRISLALGLLGVGWSACFIGGSIILTTSVDQSSRLPLQGMSDAAMNSGAAIMAALSGPLLAIGGFAIINVIAASLLLVALIVFSRARFGFTAVV